MQGSLPYHLAGKKLTKHEIVLHRTLLLDCIAVKVNLDVSSISRLRGVFLITLDVMSIIALRPFPGVTVQFVTIAVSIFSNSIRLDCGFVLYSQNLHSSIQTNNPEHFEVFFAYRRDIVSSILVSLDMAINLNL